MLSAFISNPLRFSRPGRRAGRFGTIIATLMLAGAGAVSFAANPPAPVAANPAQANTPATTALKPEGNSTLVRANDGRLLAPDIARIVNRGELIVAMLGVDTPPFFYTKNNELVGLEVELAKKIGKELKVPVRFDRSAKTFNDVVDVVARKEADLGISKLSITLARSQQIFFSDPYIRLKHAFILNRVRFAEFARDVPVPVVIRQFKGSLGVIAKSSFQDYAQRNFPQAAIKAYPTWNEVKAAVESGQVMAAYRDEFEVKRVLKSDPTKSLTLRTVTFKDLEDTLGIAVGIQDPVLLSFVNQFLAQNAEKMTIDEILQALEH